MAVSWPGTLQDKLNVDNFTITFGDTLLRSETDVGLDKVRSRYTDAVDIYTSSIDVDMDDFETFKNFYKTSLNNGATTFEFVNPLNDVLEEFRFLEPPGISPLGGRLFRVTMKWERIP